MNKILKFDTEKEFNKYVEENTCKVVLGKGREGTCYLGNNGEVYKNMIYGIKHYKYIPEEIITSNLYKNKSFIFPNVLFVVNNELVGYTMDLVNENLIDEKYIFDNGIEHINFEKLYAAYKVMCEDAIRLGEDGILIKDLPSNVMFDGERLCAIDTCGYCFTSSKKSIDNKESVDRAIRRVFDQYAELEFDKYFDEDMEIEDYLKAVQIKLIKPNKNLKR